MVQCGHKLLPHMLGPRLLNLTIRFHKVRLGNPSKTINDLLMLLLVFDWSNVVETLFEPDLRTLNDARFCQTEVSLSSSD